MPKLWVQRWEESEHGWGTRPDGCWIYPTKESAISDTIKLEKSMRKAEAIGKPAGYVPDEYSRPLGEPELMEVSAKIAKEVAVKGRCGLFDWNLKRK